MTSADEGGLVAVGVNEESGQMPTCFSRQLARLAGGLYGEIGLKGKYLPQLTKCIIVV